MKQYVVDQLRPAEFQKIKAYLDPTYPAGGIDGVYWIPIAENILTPEQAGHPGCHPLCIAVVLGSDRLSCELLLRTQKKIRCRCMAYATETQRNWVIQWIDELFEKLGVKT